MIRLSLTHFGVLGTRSVDLAPITIVVGSNGSGKSTLCDAFAAALVAPSASVQEVFRSRYGSAARALLQGLGEPGNGHRADPSSASAAVSASASASADTESASESPVVWAAGALDEDELSALHISRPGSLLFGLPADDPRSPQASDRLLGRLDVHRQALIGARDAMTACAQGVGAVAVATHTERLRAHRLERDAAWEERQRMLQMQQQIQAGERELTSCNEASERASCRIQTLDEEIRAAREQQVQVRRLLLLRRQLRALIEHGNERRELLSLAAYATDESEEIASLQAEVETYDRYVAGIVQKRQSCQERLNAVLDEISQARAQSEASKSLAAHATATKLRIQRICGEGGRGSLGQQKKREGDGAGAGGGGSSGRRLAAGSALLLLGSGWAAWMWSRGFPHGAGGVAFTPGVWVAPLYGAVMGFAWRSGKSPKGKAPCESEANLLERLRMDWNRTAPELYAMGAPGAAPMIEVCDRAIADHERLQRQLDEHVGYRCKVEEELGEVLERSHGLLLQSLEARRAARDAWLRDHHEESCDGYLAKVRRHRELEQRRDERQRAWPELLVPGREIDVEGPIAVLHRELDDLEKKGVGTECMDDAALDALRSELQSCIRERDTAEQQGEKLLQQLEQARSEVRALGRRVPEVLFEAEHQIAMTERALEEATEEVEACVEAASLLAEAADADLPGSLLQQAIDRYAARLPGSRRLRFLGLKATGGDPPESAALARDPFWASSAPDCLGLDDGAGQQPIPLERAAGSGWQDAYSLAARLALAECVSGSDTPPIMCLEEPFWRMDDVLGAACASMLQAFMRASGWYVVVISREERVARWMTGAAPEETAVLRLPG